MRREDVETCKEIARLVAKEEIAKALAALPKPAPVVDEKPVIEEKASRGKYKKLDE
jgi:hypothetical protein